MYKADHPEGSALPEDDASPYRRHSPHSELSLIGSTVVHGGRRAPHRGIAGAAAALLLSLIQAVAGAQTPAPRLSLEECTVLEDSVQARCGTYRVYEDRTAQAGRERLDEREGAWWPCRPFPAGDAGCSA